MADNTELNAGSGGNVIATDDIGSVHHQLVKIEYGADGSATQVAAGATLPCSAAWRTDVIDNAGTQLTPKFAVINENTAANNELVALVSAKKLRVISLVIVSAGTLNVTFTTASGGTALTGAIPLIANSGFSLPASPFGWIETAAGQGLFVTMSAGIQVSGALTYVEV